MRKEYEAPVILASYTEDQLISKQNELDAEGWGLSSQG